MSGRHDDPGGTHYVGDDCPGGHLHLADVVPMPAVHEQEQRGFWEYGRDPFGRDRRWVVLSPPDHCPDAEDREDEEQG